MAAMIVKVRRRIVFEVLLFLEGCRD